MAVFYLNGSGGNCGKLFGAVILNIWCKTTEKDALLGVGMTGIGSGAVLKMNFVTSPVVGPWMRSL